MSSMPRIVIAAGESLRPLIALKAERVEVIHRVNGIPSARVSLSTEGDSQVSLTEQQDEIAQCAAGQRVELLLDENTENLSLLFRGVIVRQSLDMTRSRSELVLEMRHDLARLRSTHRSQCFENETDAAILTRLLMAQGVPVLGIDGATVEHDQLVQFRCSDWHFLRSRLNANSVWLVPEPLGVEIVRPVLDVATAHTLKRRASAERDMLIQQGRWLFSAQFQPASLSTSVWDQQIQTAETVAAAVTRLGAGAFDASAGRALSGDPWSFRYSSSQGFEENLALASGLLLNLQSSRAGGEFVIDGSTAIVTGDSVRVEGFGQSFDGTGIVSGVRHHFAKDSGWRTALTIGCDDVTGDAAVTSRVSGLHIGVIDSYEDDPSGMQRLRVRLPVLGDDAGALWARLAKPYASTASGFCFYPEPGDEVIVSFFDENPSYPVILGAMHNPVTPAPIGPSAENRTKAIVMGAADMQCQLLFDVRDSTVTVSGPHDKATLGQGMQLQSESELSVKSEALTLSGASSVSIKGPKIGFDPNP
jgi:type VI secretion system secreted protein VgrG